MPSGNYQPYYYNIYNNTYYCIQPYYRQPIIPDGYKMRNLEEIIKELEEGKIKNKFKAGDLVRAMNSEYDVVEMVKFTQNGLNMVKITKIFKDREIDPFAIGMEKIFGNQNLTLYGVTYDIE